MEMKKPPFPPMGEKNPFGDKPPMGRPPFGDKPPMGMPPMGGPHDGFGPPPGWMPPMADISWVKRKFLDVPYGTESKQQCFDIYLPDEGDGPFPLFVHIHGGGFAFGDKRDDHMDAYLLGIKRGYGLLPSSTACPPKPNSPRRPWTAGRQSVTSRPMQLSTALIPTGLRFWAALPAVIWQRW